MFKGQDAHDFERIQAEIRSELRKPRSKPTLRTAVNAARTLNHYEVFDGSLKEFWMISQYVVSHLKNIQFLDLINTSETAVFSLPALGQKNNLTNNYVLLSKPLDKLKSVDRYFRCLLGLGHIGNSRAIEISKVNITNMPEFLGIDRLTFVLINVETIIENERLLEALVKSEFIFEIAIVGKLNKRIQQNYEQAHNLVILSDIFSIIQTKKRQDKPVLYSDKFSVFCITYYVVKFLAITSKMLRWSLRPLWRLLKFPFWRIRMTSYLEKILTLMTAQEKRQSILLFVLIFVMAVLNVAGVASVMPFIALVSDPQIIYRNDMLMAAYLFFGSENINDFMVVIGCVVCLIFAISLGVKALTDFLLMRFSLKLEYSLSRRLLDRYLKQKYVWFLNRSGADLGKAILDEVSNVTGSAIIPLLTVAANGILAVAMIALVIVINPIVALIATLTLSCSYAVLFWCFRDYLVNIGQRRGAANLRRFEVTGEAFAAIKEIKLGNLESVYADQFDEPALTYANSRAMAQAVGTLPRHLLEAIAFGGLLVLMIVVILKEGDINAVLPAITVYALAGYRLMPALQQVYNALSNLKFFGPALNELYDDFYRLEPVCLSIDEGHSPEILGNIKIENVTFSYPGTSKPVIQNLNVEIERCSMVGFVGPTGGARLPLLTSFWAC